MRRDPWPPEEDLPPNWERLAVFFSVGFVVAGFWLIVIALLRWAL